MPRLERAAVALAVAVAGVAAHAAEVSPAPLRVVLDEVVPSEVRHQLREAGAEVVVRPTVSTSHRAAFLEKVLRTADAVELALPLSDAVVRAVRALPANACRVHLVGDRFGPADRTAVDRLGPCRLRLTLTAPDAGALDRWPLERGPVTVFADTISLQASGILAKERRVALLLPAQDWAAGRPLSGTSGVRVGVSFEADALDGDALARLGAAAPSLVVVHGLPAVASIAAVRLLPGEAEWRLRGPLGPEPLARLRAVVRSPTPADFRAPTESQLDAPLRNLPAP